MSSPVPAPLGLTADFAGIMRLYQASWSRCWLPGALLALLWTGLLAVLIRSLTAQDDVLLLAEQMQELMLAPAVWQLLLGATLVSIVLFSAQVASMHAVATGERLGTGRALLRALAASPAAVVAATIFIVLTSIGTMLLVIPGAYLWGMWQLWVVALVAERAGPLAALGSSWRLTRGFWWPAMTLTTLATLAVILPLLVLTDDSVKTLVLGLVQFQTRFVTNYGPQMAGYTIGALPLLLLFSFGMRQFVAGITSGALKL